MTERPHRLPGLALPIVVGTSPMLVACMCLSSGCDGEGDHRFARIPEVMCTWPVSSTWSGTSGIGPQSLVGANTLVVHQAEVDDTFR